MKMEFHDWRRCVCLLVCTRAAHLNLHTTQHIFIYIHAELIHLLEKKSSIEQTTDSAQIVANRLVNRHIVIGGKATIKMK